MKKKLGKGIAALIPNAAEVKKNNVINTLQSKTPANKSVGKLADKPIKTASKPPISSSKMKNPVDIFFENTSTKTPELNSFSTSKVASRQASTLENIGAYFDEISLDKIKTNFKQPRSVFDNDALNELAASIKEVGILQPIIVRENKKKNEKPFELIMGERRFRASKLAKKKTIPAIVRQTEDTEMLRTALIENIHRVDLTPIEEASAYKQLMSDFNFTQQELSEKIGISRPKIANTLRLLNLPPAILKALDEEKISEGHARTLLAIDNDDKKIEVCKKITKEKLSVRQVEALVVSTFASSNKKNQVKASVKRVISIKEEAKYKEYAEQLEDLLSTDVSIQANGKEKRISISFADSEDLQRIIKIIKRSKEVL